MAKVGIVTDSIACLPPEILEKYDIRVVPVALNINGKPYRDGIDIKYDEFWKIFPEIKEFTTGAPALSEYTDLYSELLKTCDSVVGAFVSFGLSAIGEAAVQAGDSPRVSVGGAGRGLGNPGEDADFVVPAVIAQRCPTEGVWIGSPE